MCPLVATRQHCMGDNIAPEESKSNRTCLIMDIYIYIEHSGGFLYVEHQVSLTATDPIKYKILFERDMQQ